MTPAELQGLLAISGYESRVHGEEVKVRTCWNCGNDRFNMELNPVKGIWSCWACRDGGRLDRLLSSSLGSEFSIPVHFDRRGRTEATVVPDEFQKKPALEVPSAAHYLLSKRGLPEAVIRGYGLSVCVEPGHRLEGRILFPMFDYWSGELQGYTARSYTGEKPKYLTTAPLRVVCGYRSREKGTPVVLVEGFLDGIAVHRAGYQAAVLGGTDSPEVVEFVARIPPRAPVVILLDGEAEEEATRLFWTLHPLRGFSLLRGRLPQGCDPASLLPEVLRMYLETLLPQRLHETS